MKSFTNTNIKEARKWNKRKKLREDQLETVSGGTSEEFYELKAFIDEHDPDAPTSDEIDVMRWLRTKSGIKFEYLYVNRGDNYNNFTLLGGRKIGNGELMAMLRENFPD